MTPSGFFKLCALAWAATVVASPSDVVDESTILERDDTSSFDTLAALAELGLNASNFATGATSATLVGQDVGSTAARRSSVNPCAYSCASLNLLFSGHVFYPNSSGYELADSVYWSVQQEEVEPYCTFEPTEALGVSATVLLARLTTCPFAVKSGGHAAFAGASNIQGGITVSFTNLDTIQRNLNGNTTSIQPGNTWYDVYSTLEPENVTVIGGRVAAIGVGGLTLGGGISFFSGLYGFACDNVLNYEVVTATGAIVNANETSYPDLYWALRGGGNNFGIVTRFDLETYPQGPMWGGEQVYLPTYTSDVLAALYQYGVDAPSDPNAAIYFAHGYVAAEGIWLDITELVYALPVENPAIFDAFYAIPTIENTASITNLTELTLEVNATNPGGLRESYWTATYKNSLEMMEFIVNECEQEFAPVLNVSGILPVCIQQIITPEEQSHMTKRGGNPLGLDGLNESLILLNIAVMWEDSSADDAILAACQKIIDNTVAQAAAWGVDLGYLYMNYASQFQNVVPSYNATNHAKLVSIAEKYDPTGVFQTLQPGYFKLNSAPASLA